MGTFGGSDFGSADFTDESGRGPLRPSDVVSRREADMSERLELPDWASEDEYWRHNFGSRPYARADLAYEHYQPAYRYGYESAGRLGGSRWEEVESELRAGWEVDHADDDRSAWENVKDAVKDAWDRLTGFRRDR